MRPNLIRIVALPNLQFLTSILIPALPSQDDVVPASRKGFYRRHALAAEGRCQRRGCGTRVAPTCLVVEEQLASIFRDVWLVMGV